MIKNLVFITGPQGAGKSTLLESLKSKNVLVPQLKTSVFSMMEASPYERRFLKICQRALENYEYLSIARKNKGKIVVGDRCIYCIDAFGEVYARKGWITNEERELSCALAQQIFLPELLNPPAIVLNPGFDVVWRHLQQRWEREEKKWNEDDVEYIWQACEVYKQYKNNKKFFYIGHEINLNSKRETKPLLSWLENITGISFSLSL